MGIADQRPKPAVRADDVLFAQGYRQCRGDSFPKPHELVGGRFRGIRLQRIRGQVGQADVGDALGFGNREHEPSELPRDGHGHAGCWIAQAFGLHDQVCAPARAQRDVGIEFLGPHAGARDDVFGRDRELAVLVAQGGAAVADADGVDVGEDVGAVRRGSARHGHHEPGVVLHLAVPADDAALESVGTQRRAHVECGAGVHEPCPGQDVAFGAGQFAQNVASDQTRVADVRVDAAVVGDQGRQGADQVRRDLRDQ